MVFWFIYTSGFFSGSLLIYLFTRAEEKRLRHRIKQYRFAMELQTNPNCEFCEENECDSRCIIHNRIANEIFGTDKNTDKIL